MLMERVSNKELLCLIDMKQERLQEIYDEQTRLQQEITDLTSVMMQRGLDKFSKLKQGKFKFDFSPMWYLPVELVSVIQTFRVPEVISVPLDVPHAHEVLIPSVE